MQPSDASEVKWFRDSAEAFRCMCLHQEEYSARGLFIVFCESLWRDQVQHSPDLPPTPTSTGREACPLVNDPWLEQKDDTARADGGNQPETPVKLDGGHPAGTQRFESSSHSDSSQICSRSEGSVVQTAKEVNRNTRNNAEEALVGFPRWMRKGKTDIQHIAQYFHLPINDAAKELGICLTVLKKICRRNGLKRWPHRKLKSIDKILVSMDAVALLRETNESNDLLNTTTSLGDNPVQSAYDLLGVPDTKLEQKPSMGAASFDHVLPELVSW
eukprot:CAMPEP_0118927046 /NCGR_PEP_ID=MMETSP1169-20130426/4615_1 /TAXON_ID=36882 /ORGANISM="Pyramimonas obovata, Strain CCMP722" /LENGTH=271 /DNA_ID=CAMNT_0006868737 /DNA_START=206 /DNA_END=1018 /DNA_ORIENTATION=-